MGAVRLDVPPVHDGVVVVDGLVEDRPVRLRAHAEHGVGPEDLRADLPLVDAAPATGPPDVGGVLEPAAHGRERQHGGGQHGGAPDEQRGLAPVGLGQCDDLAEGGDERGEPGRRARPNQAARAPDPSRAITRSTEVPAATTRRRCGPSPSATPTATGSTSATAAPR